jgi:hypothetical protein
MSKRVFKMLREMGYRKGAIKEILNWYCLDKGDRENDIRRN